MTRVAYGRINQETNCLSPVTTSFEDFKRTHFFEGDALSRAIDTFEVPGMFKRAELHGFVSECKKRGVEVVPLLSAWAVPSGPLTQECFDDVVGRFVAHLVSAIETGGAVDGVYLCLHGAMGVVGLKDAEAEIVKRVRNVVGSAPVVVSYDLHANLTRDVIENVDALVAYVTNPHRDHARCGAKAARILIDTVTEQVKPTTAWRSLPMLLGGGTTIDLFPPLFQIFRRMRALEKSGEVLSASLLTCHPWNAHPELGWAIVVVTDGDLAKAERIADELAERAWGTRHQLPPVFESAQSAIAKARAARVRRKLGVVVVADASDVVSAGAPGESTALLEALINDAQGLVCLVPIRDPAAVSALWSKSVGDVVDVTLGGRLDPKRNRALAVHGVVENKCTSLGVDRTVVLAVGTVKIVIVAGPALAVRPSFFTNAGLKPWRADVVVVKNFFPFRMFFLPMARLTMYVRTAGVTDFDAAFALTFAGKVHPKDVVDDWRDADRRRHAA